VISFIGRAMSEEPEYDVEKDPRTDKTTENPAFTLGIIEAGSRPHGADRAVKYEGRYYPVWPIRPGDHDLEMTVAGPPRRRCRS
jgi:hypothetical protein